MSILSRITGLRIAGLAAAVAVAVAGVVSAPTQARASDDDLIRFLLGAAAVAVIVHSFSDRPRDTSRRYTGNVLPDHCRETLRARGRLVEVYNAHCLQRAGLNRLPHHCAETVPTNRGDRRVFRERCLTQAGYRTESRYQQPRHPQRPALPQRPSQPSRAVLPQRCEISYRQRGQSARGYDGSCLSRAGLRNLPGHCALNARTERGGQLTIYNARCLTDAGYHTERGRRR